MGLFDRLLGLLGGSSETVADSQSAVANGRTETSDEAKSGSHGSHWDTLVGGDDDIKRTVMRTVETGDVTEAPPVDGRDIVGYRAGDSSVGTVAVTADGEIWTAYPAAEGVEHRMHVDGLIPWRNGVEAQLRVQLDGAELNLFPTNFFAETDDAFGGERRVELAALAYDCEPAEAETIRDDSGEEFSTAGMAALLPFERGDVDDYTFQTRVKEVERESFDGRTVYRLLVPLFRTEDGDDVNVYLYAAEHVLGEFVPEVGDDIAGVLWLQGRVE